MVYGSDFISWAMERRWQVFQSVSDFDVALNETCSNTVFCSTWRPLRGPLYDWPLALCDHRSVDTQSDFETGDNIYPRLESESLLVYHNNHHRWHYLSEMQPDEVLVFKSYDSHGSGDIAVCKHTGHIILI